MNRLHPPAIVKFVLVVGLTAGAWAGIIFFAAERVCR